MNAMLHIKSEMKSSNLDFLELPGELPPHHTVMVTSDGFIVDVTKIETMWNGAALVSCMGMDAVGVIDLTGIAEDGIRSIYADTIRMREIYDKAVELYGKTPYRYASEQKLMKR